MKTIQAFGLLAALAAGSAHASVELVTNGGFETGDFTGWTTNHGGTTVVRFFTPTPLNGDFAAGFFGRPVGIINQTLSTQAGTPYELQFDLLNDKGISSDPATVQFKVSFGGQDVLGGNPSLPIFGGPGFPFTHYDFILTALSNAAVLQFSGLDLDAPGGFTLDNVSVQAAPVPAPAAIWLLGPALGGLGFARRRSV